MAREWKRYLRGIISTKYDRI